LNETGHEVVLYHKISTSAIEEIQKQKPFLTNFEEIPHFIENFKARLLRESLAYARILRNEKKLQNKTILQFWSPSKKGVKKKVLYFVAELLGLFLSKKYSRIRKADLLFEKEIANSKTCKEIGSRLQKIQPDFILNLHQRSPVASPIISASHKLNIQTATVIFSWDNVPKARLVSRYNYYYVWSELMKRELQLLYPEILSSQIKITGTPQFEFYCNKRNFEEKKTFFNRYGLDINKKTVCFSANDTTSPYEVNYLKDICEEVSKIQESIRPQIIFRRCPVDKTTRFDKILEKYKHLLSVIDPDWRTEKEGDATFTSIYPTYHDNSLLVNTIQHSDVVINLGSTMAHDAAVLDTPCLYVKYDPVPNSAYKVNDIYKFQHFKSMNDIEAVGWINDKSEILDKIMEAISTPEKTGKERKQWLERIVLHPLEDNSITLKNTIIECI
jgi:hypothetical protein